MNQNMQTGSGLTRYRSAPSTYFSSFLDNTSSDGGFGDDDFAQLFNARASSPETQRIFARFMNSPGTVRENDSTNITMLSQSQVKSEPETEQPQPLLQNTPATVNTTAVAGSSSDRVLGSNRRPEMKMNTGGGGLLRHNSSPAGLFDNIINIQSEFGAMRRIRNSGAGIMPPISENQTQIIEENNPGDDGDLINPWDDSDSAMLSDDFFQGLTGMETKVEASDNQNSEEDGVRSSRPPLSHHLSLPKSPAMKKLLRDSVPCKLRAKRGFATHPRSIAERVRRTKISERMRKLQELVPNMEKQTNTSDMLDLAVHYIKDLEGKVKTLSDIREKCNCSAKDKP